MGRTLHLSFFLSWVSKTQPNHWTKRMAIDTIFLFHSFFLLCSFFLSFFLLCSPFFLKLSSKSFWRRISKKICKKDFANSKDNGFPSYVRCGAGLALAGLLRWMDLYLDRQQRHRVYGRQRMVRSLEGSLIPPLAQHSNEMQLDQ